MRHLLLLMLLYLPPSAKAQQPFSADDPRIFHGALNLGANFCQVDGDGFSGYHKVGLAGGAQVYVRLFPIVHISLGLGYAQKGSHESSLRDTYLGPAVFRYRLDLQYAEVPLLLHLFLPGGRLPLHYSAGIAYSRLINSAESAEDVNPISIDPDLYPLQKQDWYGIAGVSYHIGGQFFLSGQYQYTIGSIRSEPYIPPGYGYGRERNNVMSLRLLYIIRSGAANN